MRVHSGPKKGAPIVGITLHPICTPIAGTECSNFKMDIQMINLDSTPYLSGGMLQGSAHSRDRGTHQTFGIREITSQSLPRNQESLAAIHSGRSHSRITPTPNSNRQLMRGPRWELGALPCDLDLPQVLCGNTLLESL